MVGGNHVTIIMNAKITCYVTAIWISVGEKLAMTLLPKTSVVQRGACARRRKETVKMMQSAKDPLNVARTTALGHQAGILAPTAAMIQEFAYIILTQFATNRAQVLILPEL